MLRDHVAFFRQFRETFQTTGAIAPSSRFLASAITRPLRRRSQPMRILEVGPGTGAVTKRIVGLLQPGDQLELVELNETFAGMLQKRFDEDPAYQQVSSQSRIHVCGVEEFQSDAPFDCIVSGLPLNNFSPQFVEEVIEALLDLLAPGGTLSYFEYMYVRPVRRAVSAAKERDRLAELERLLQGYLSTHRIRRDWVFLNFPPAWVQHLRKA